MRHDKFGFAVEINVPASIADFSISMDFKGTNSFNMQTWNLEYWNFYKGNTFVVLHSKRSTMDLEDRFSKLIVVEGLSIRKYRKYKLFNKTYNKKRKLLNQMNSFHYFYFFIVKKAYLKNLSI